MAIVATTVVAGVALSLGSRSFAVSAAAAEFDHLLDSARTAARETEGATLVFAPDAYGDGTEVRILAPGADGTLAPTSFPIVHTHAAIEEQQSLGKTPFAFVVHVTGALGGRPGYRLGDSTASGEVGCPPSGSFHFVIHAAGASADRFIPCRVPLAATGPVALASWPPTPIAPAPTPCTSGPCAPAALPTPPSSTPTCPPNYVPAAGGCTPASAPSGGSGPRYHVTATLANPTMTMGGPDDSFTARADLTNASAVAPGTPSSLPVQVQNSTATCATTPAGPQASGSIFTLKAISPGPCVVAIGADPSSVPNATTDTATLNLTITDSSTPPPLSLSCDLRANLKCYHRIIESTDQTFSKFVEPDSGCITTADGSESCTYVDSIKDIYIGRGYGFRLPLPATDSSHELLFRIIGYHGLFSSCQPYSYFATIPTTTPIDWAGFGIGVPVDAPPGWGEPSVFGTVSHVVVGSQPGGFFYEPDNRWTMNTTFQSLFTAVARGDLSDPYNFTFSSDNSTAGQEIVWYPDFPGCDVEGDRGAEYGNIDLNMVFEIYQATGN